MKYEFFVSQPGYIEVEADDEDTALNKVLNMTGEDVSWSDEWMIDNIQKNDCELDIKETEDGLIVGLTTEFFDDDRLKVETQFGTLIAEPSGDPDYPGVWISITQPRGDGDGEYEANLVLVESGKDPDGESGLRVLVWSDPEKEDYTHSIGAQFVKHDETIIS